MIYVRRDPSVIPQKLLDMAARAQAELEGLGPNDRRRLIKRRARVWRLFGRHLARMSYGKCWYSESPDPQSFFDVDHYRPKLQARRSDSEVDEPGYEWLAFSWENFRYAASCSNRVQENIETGAVEGKGSWFPLLEGSAKASWANRCEAQERPVLLDPTNRRDVALVAVDDDGRIVPSRCSVGSEAMRVSRSCELYGLNLPRIKDARRKIMRDVQSLLDILADMVECASDAEMPSRLADKQPIAALVEQIRSTTRVCSPYSLAARAALFAGGYPELCADADDVEPCLSTAA